MRKRLTEKMSSESKPIILFIRHEIDAAVKKLAADISRDYRDKHPILIGILKGSFMFMANLIRLLDFPLEAVVDKLDRVERAAADLGTALPSSFSTLSFLALPVIPELRLTDLGLVDVNQFRLIK